jgi:hypothetical protein
MAEELADDFHLLRRVGGCNELSIYDPTTQAQRQIYVSDRRLAEIRQLDRAKRRDFVLKHAHDPGWQCTPMVGGEADFIEHLRRELARVGRPDVCVEQRPNGTVRLEAHDGIWEGPGPAANIALDRCPDGDGTRPDFWGRFPR